MKTHANARLSLKGREQPCSGATGLQAARQRVGRDARPGAKLTRCQSRARGAPAGSARRERRTRGAGAGGRDEKEQAAGGERAEGSLAHCHRWVTWTVAVLTVRGPLAGISVTVTVTREARARRSTFTDARLRCRRSVRRAPA